MPSSTNTSDEQDLLEGTSILPSRGPPSIASSDGSNSSDNMIVRLCGGQRQLNSDRAGRLRFFGPTSSLHLSESIVSSVLINEGSSNRGHFTWQEVLPQDLQDYLLALYWEYQHQVIPVIHKEGELSDNSSPSTTGYSLNLSWKAFLRDFSTGQTKYCSKLLVHCILTRAAAISDRAEIRALALADDETNEDPPYLVRRCAALLDSELNNPGITTLQSLQLLSEIYCVISNDTKGWLDAGKSSPNCVIRNG